MKFSLKSYFLTAIVISAVVVLYFVNFGHQFLQQDTTQRKERIVGGNKKLILFGSPWWHPHYPFQREAEKLCPSCVFTENLQLFKYSDAVVFHGISLNRKPPLKRPKSQIWVYLVFEAQAYKANDLKVSLNYPYMFNWTMTYRRDSDVFMPYGRFFSMAERSLPSFSEKWAFIPGAVPHQNELYDDSILRPPTLEELKGRKMAAWIVSHCETHSKREVVAQELGKHIDLDIYGDCGNLKCEVPKPKALSGIDCRFEISKKYKFYLAFENSLCEDYVTEKYFDALYTQMVPIVYGAANYSQLAPPKSFINVADYDSFKSLAKYLNFLDKNPEEYLKYFEWRKDHWVQNNRFALGYCALCEKLWNQDSNQETKIYENIYEWWDRRSDFELSQRKSCFLPDELDIFKTDLSSQLHSDRS